MSRSEAFQFRLPPQDLSALTFCKPGVEGMKSWIDALPRANLGETTRALYDAVNEVTRWKATSQQRFEILELLRPVIYVACQGLEKHFLQQPVILPEQPRKVAELAQSLQYQLMRSYTLTAATCIDKMKALFNKPTALMTTAIHRAISDASQILIRSFQLYQSTRAHLWEEIHLLVRLAEHYKLAATDVRDPLGKASTIAQIYTKTLLLGCIKANQLRQDDILVIWNTLDQWAGAVHFYPVDRGEEKLLIVDPHTDSPPMYRRFYSGDFNADCRQLDTANLISQLKILTDPALSGDGPVSRNLLNHLILAWGVLTDRTFMRLEANARLALCIGLSTTHYFVSGELSFEQLVRGDGNAREPSNALFLVDDGRATSARSADAADAKLAQPLTGKKPAGDVWDGAIDADHGPARVSLESIDYHVRKGGRTQMTSSGTDREKYQNFEVQMINMSPGGYRLEWPDQAPLQLKTGEIIGIREAHHASWSIGAIRWVRQEPDAGLHLGVELLSPAAVPYGARVLQKRGDVPSDYMRVLTLPEIKPLGQPMTLLTPAVSFREGQKVVLMRQGQESTVLLTRLVTQTAAYSQFEFQLSKRIGEPPQKSTAKPEGRDEGFDSLWHKL
jgi:cyclic-di-GMP-binding protein